MFDWNVLRLVLSIIASLLHTFGFYALWSVKRNNPYLMTQRLYLIHLSVSENAHSIFLAHYYTFKLCEEPEWQNYMMICCGGTFIWFLSILIMLTLDRFCTVYLHTRYLSVCTRRRTKMVLLACFLLSVTANVVFLLALPSLEITLAVFSTYLWFPSEVFFIVLLVSIYAYISWRVFFFRSSAIKPLKKQTPHTFSQVTSPLSLRDIGTSPALLLKRNDTFYDDGFPLRTKKTEQFSVRNNSFPLRSEDIELSSPQNSNRKSISIPNMRIELKKYPSQENSIRFQNPADSGTNFCNENENSCNNHQTPLHSSLKESDNSTTSTTTTVKYMNKDNSGIDLDQQSPPPPLPPPPPPPPKIVPNKIAAVSTITITTTAVQYKKHRKTGCILNHKKTILVPLWLITTFVVFIAIPDVGYFICLLLERPRPHLLRVAAAFYPVGIISDALIYIFFVKEVRLSLIKKLRVFYKRKR